jgi:hypothetical protein
VRRGQKRGIQKGDMVEFFVFVYKNRMIKPAEIALQSRGGMRENDGGGAPN